MSSPARRLPSVPPETLEFQKPVSSETRRGLDPRFDLKEIAQREAEVVIRQVESRADDSSRFSLHDAGERIVAVYDVVLQSAAEAWSQAADTLRDSAQSRPQQFIAVVAGVGFATGFMLRLWRDHA